ncbi:hypothetical protein PK35_10285 [Tamlana nanhaiensis]|uniref:Outer membrane protein beta-barrel domain-containing protein n=1 Tax=Neotamlana nanhaiensis TaxID=1382798 RepID=A0A0D7W0G7_9FLAO|nr:porin family protein [Tamlana nanhaiensis]KJD32581.1 hypothetical protein PK35_10285 [Tamlana nanhaiensis]
MKTTLFTFLMAFALFFQTEAQNDNLKSGIGIKGGYNLAAVSFDGDSETGQRHGFHAGIYAESYIAEVASVQIEALYSQQGFEIKDDSGTFTQKLDYINLPISLKIYPVQHFFVEAGPQIGIAVSHKEEFDGNGFFNITSEEEPENFDWGFNFGGGFKTDSGVTLGARYHLGMGSVYEESNPKNRVWQFYIGFGF